MALRHGTGDEANRLTRLEKKESIVVRNEECLPSEDKLEEVKKYNLSRL
jgi:hypothetical protein